MTKPGASVFVLKISLNGARPPIWRRVQVPGEISLYQLHRVIQRAMGWDDCHLHHFEFGGLLFEPGAQQDPGIGGEFGPEWRDSTKTMLNQLVKKPKSKLRYKYDFGDGWEHTILVEKILTGADAPGLTDPICLKGARNCPPEDCGGIWGYQNLAEVMADPSHPEHEDMLEWHGEYDAEDFSPAETNVMLAGVLKQKEPMRWI